MGRVCRIVAACLVWVGCGRLGFDEIGPPGSNHGNDGPSAAGDGQPAQTTIDAAACTDPSGPQAVPSTGCHNFDSWPSGDSRAIGSWQSSSTGLTATLTADANASTSPPNSLRFDWTSMDNNSNGANVIQEINPPTAESHAILTTQLRVDQNGGGTVIAAAIYLPYPPAPYASYMLEVRLTGAQVSFGSYLPVSGSDQGTSVPVSIDLSVWHQLAIEVDIQAGVASLRDGGTEVATLNIPKVVGPYSGYGYMNAQIGGIDPINVVSSWTLRFDDVYVDAL